MSLILDALRKLDREKRAPASGLLVIGGTSWPGVARAFGPLLFLLVLAFATGLVAALLWLRPSPPAAADAAGESEEPAPLAPAAAARPPLAQSPADEPEAEPTERPERSRKRAARAAAAPETDTGEPAIPSPRPRRAQPSQAPAYTLQAISERDGHAVAIINDRLLREGDSLDGARVVKIAADEVELEVGGRRVVLRF